MSTAFLHRALICVPMCSELSDDADYERFEFDDGTVRIHGTPPAAVRDALLRTHVEGGLDSDGRTIWYPVEASDDS